MKLRNKKNGEIGYFCFANWNDPVLIVMDKNGVQLAKYTSLAELNSEWEDYEEPKGWWYIDCNGEVFRGDVSDKKHTDEHKSIGNYYTSSEEAEKAVEKLKAWKRLKEKGFRFNGWVIPERPKTPHIKLVIEAEMDVPDSPYDLDTCFGGEE